MSASRWRDERGVTIPLLALLIGTLIVMVATAVDLGRQRSDRRLAQAGADVIALDMMRVVEGRTFDEVLNDPATLVALSESAARNDFANAVGTVVDSHLPRITNIEWGSVATLGDGDTFVEYGLPADAARVPTAVRITAERTTDYFFQPGEKGVTRLAIAAFPSPTVDLAVGSVGAAFQPNVPSSVTLDATVEALNARLAAHFGATVPNPGSAGFDLVGYRGLAAADVDVWRVAANAGFASPNEMADSDMTVGQFFSATATALDQQAAEGDPNAANAAAELRRFEAQMGTDSTGTMRLGDTMSFEQGGDDAAAEGAINVLDFLSGGANVVNGQNFASYQLSPGFPGVAVANVRQYLVRKETFRNDRRIGQTVENSQTRFQIDLEVAPLTGMSTPLTIPIVVEAANAIGTVDRLDCADPLLASEAGIGMVTSGASVRLGTATDLAAETLVVTPGVFVEAGLLNDAVLLALGLSPLQILGLDLDGGMTASGSASVLGGSSDHTFLPYQPPVDYQRSPGGLGATTIGSQLSSSLTANVGGSVLSSTATTALRNQLSYVFTDLQALIIDPILQQAGITVAGADVKATDLKCEGAGLKLVG